MYAKSGSTKGQGGRRERGVAMLIAVLALLLLSAITFTLIYSTITETGINSNDRQEEMAYFAARAGVEEARDRMSTAAGVVGPIVPPPAPPGQPGGYAIYLINQGTDPIPVQPWSVNNPNSASQPNPYLDDDLCHDGFTGLGLTAVAPGVRCTAVPGGSGWYQTVTSNIQWNGTAAALPYKWVRIGMKENGSVEYGDPATSGTQTYYSVNPTVAATQPVCYDGTSERVPPTGTTTCAAWAPTVYANPVYMITAMAVSQSGARKVVQTEVGLPPNPPFPYGLFATGTGCGAITWNGSSFSNSYNSANGSYAKTETASGGDIGTFGNASFVGSANVEGIVGVTGTAPYAASVGACPGNGVSETGSIKTQGIQALAQGLTFPTPPAPSPTPPTTTTTYNGAGKATVPPGTYGNISLNGSYTLVLSPGVYNLNSLAANGMTNICVSPPGQVVLNIAGQGGTALNLNGASTDDQTASACGSSATQSIPANFVINYGGTDSITINGQSASYLVLNAPNAALTLNGAGDMYGAVVAKTILYNGAGNFHYDLNSAFRPVSSQNYTTLSFREVSY